jgi:outer membrane protein OmpA-like peptidoglycan-associated protein
MKNIKALITVIVVLFVQLTQSQEQDLIRAKRYFDRTYYSEALPFYENVANTNRSPEVVKNLADCYYYTNDLKKAERWYRLLITNYSKDLNTDYYFKYAQTLKASEKYKESDKVMRDFLAKSDNKEALSKYEKDLKILENVTAIGQRFDIKNLAVNTKNSEFGGLKNGTDFVFSGVRNKLSLFDKTYKWNNEAYLDLKITPLNNLKSNDSIVSSAFDNINTVLHESNAIFTKDGKTMYFTRNNYNEGKRGKDKNKVSNLQIFKSEYKDNKWGKAISLSFNSPNFSNEHPALSHDEKILYFASDRPGSLGSFDIYSVEVNDGLFGGTPKNLGDKINTKYKEQFPFASADNKLYFSSNGLLGYGSLDIFVSDILGDDFSAPVNVGLPINSSADDFSFNMVDKEGYFSSNRAGGKGGDDIYSLKETKPLLVEDCKQLITGVLSDVDTSLPLGGALVVLQNSQKQDIDNATTGIDGKFSFTVACESSFTVLASKELYTKNEKFVKTNTTRYKNNDASMTLKSEEAIKREAELAAEKEKKEKEIAEENAKKQAEIDRKNELERQKQERIAAKEALKNKAKQDKADRLAAKLERNKKAVPEKEDKLVTDPSKKGKIDDLLAKEKDIIKDKDNRLLIKTDPIYFDYTLWYIRRESKPILNRVIELMKKYPEMVVEIGSHTDNRGTDKNNMTLSGKRAASTRDYFIQQGVPENRIFSEGYGESRPIIKCNSEKECTEEDHELNRRSEFVIKNL